MPRVLITGSSGFIGQQLVEQMVRTHQVRVLTRSARAVRRDVERCVLPDGADVRECAAVMRDVDLVVHLASIVHRARASELEMARVNVHATRILCEAATLTGVPHFIFISSIAAVGSGSRGRIDEATAPRPIRSYGRSKLAAERTVLEVTAPTHTAATVLRPPMVYGPGMKGNPLKLFRALSRHMPLPFLGARNRRSTLFVGNLVSAILHLATRVPESNKIFNVADREATSVEDFVRSCAAALGVRPWLVPSPYSLLRVVTRVSERVTSGAASAAVAALAESVGGSLELCTLRLENETGFQPPWSRESGLLETAQWFRGTRF